jgi:hypothetical protein
MVFTADRVRPRDELNQYARDERLFANGTEAYAWQENWCRQCHNSVELASRRYENGERKTPPKDFPGGCPLLLMSWMGRIPTEWLEQPLVEGLLVLGHQFRCIEYPGPDYGVGEPGPPRPRP